MKTKTKKIDQEDFIKLLKAHKGAAIMTIEAVTEANCVSGNPFGKVYKHVELSVMTGASYGKSVNRQLKKVHKAANFKADPLPYGEFSVPNKVIEVDGKSQLRTIVRNTKKPSYVQYFNEKKERIEEKDIMPYLRLTVSAKQKKHGVPIKRQRKCRNYDFSNIKSILWRGVKYIF